MSRIAYHAWLFLMVLAAFSIGGWYLGQEQIDDRLDDLKASHTLSVEITAERISGMLNETAWQLRSMVDESLVRRSLDESSGHDRLKMELQNLASRNPDYHQVRWIDEQGLEHIRVQRVNGHTMVIDSSYLQDKSDRYYFKETMRLGAQEVYFSKLDLNVEHGEIEQPIRPTVRIGIRVFDQQDRPRGILVVNRDVKGMLKLLSSSLHQERMMLVNDQGQWVIGPIMDYDWGFMYGKTSGPAIEMPYLWKQLQNNLSGQLDLDGSIWFWSTYLPARFRVDSQVNIADLHNRYVLLTQIDANELAMIRQAVWMTLLPFVLGASVLFWLLLVRLVDSRERIRETAMRLAESERARKMQQRIDAAERQAQAVIDSNINGMLSIDHHGVIVTVNPALEKLFGYDPGELLGKPLEVLVPAALREVHVQDRQQFAEQPKERRMREGLSVEGVHKSGKAIPVEVSLSPVSGDEGIKVNATIFDIRNRIENEKVLRQMASVFENTGDAIVITDADSLIINVNNAFEEITGYTLGEVQGKSPNLYASGRHSSDFYRDMERAIHQRSHWHGEHSGRRKDGKIYSEWLTVSKVTNTAGEVINYVHVFSDISRLKDSERQLDRLTYLDTLTELPNRRMFLMRLEHAIEQTQRRKHSLAVIILDLDNFKHINDALGHAVGDQLLQKMASSLKQHLRNEDTVARLGGDEFALLMEDIASPENATVLAAKLIEQLDRPVVIDEHEIRVTSSMGICFYPYDGEDVDTLMRNADAAMYRAKEDGRNCYHFYTESLTTRSVERVNMENSLRQSLEREDFYLVYQPQVDLRTGALIGVEALIRWEHPEIGPISPARFIPMAEETSLIFPLERWVIRKACEQARNWLDKGIHFGRMAINMSGRTINAGGVKKLMQQILLETRCPAEVIELEVSEGFIMQRAMASIDELNELRKMGIAISIDDFGTGYSSLSYLKQLPIDKLKIDQAFVRDIDMDENDRAIVSAVIAMGNKLNLKVIAEGVETEAQALFLSGEGCDEAQGYLYSKPVKPDQIELLQQKLGQPKQNGDQSKVIVFPQSKRN